MIDLVSNSAVTGVVALLVAMEAFQASHKFVCQWCILVAVDLWPHQILVEHVVHLGCYSMAVVSPREA